jgi:hypothetical protein
MKLLDKTFNYFEDNGKELLKFAIKASVISLFWIILVA